MTENEAIYCLKAEREHYPEVCEECTHYGKVGCDYCYEDAFSVAIQALEETQQYRAIGLTLEVVQELKIMDIEQDGEIRGIIKSLKELGQYRAIGTVEELKTMKENGAFSGVELAQLAAMQMRLKEYQAIGTIEEFKALKEKNTPYKPKEYEDRYYACKCGNVLLQKWEKYPIKMMPKNAGLPRCMACGQAIDWSE